MVETLRCQGRVEVEACERLHESIVRGDEVVGEVSVNSDPVRSTNPLQSMRKYSVEKLNFRPVGVGWLITVWLN